MSVCYECCVLSGRGLCVGLITHPEESYRVCLCSICDVAKPRKGRPCPGIGSKRHRKKKIKGLIRRLNSINTVGLSAASGG